MGEDIDIYLINKFDLFTPKINLNSLKRFLLTPKKSAIILKVSAFGVVTLMTIPDGASS